ncbi:MAG: hypothetical protein AB7P17_14985 [Nitrospirales bacterium]
MPIPPFPTDPRDPERGSLFFAILAILVFTGCAERPSSQIDAVEQSLQDARLAGAEAYAIEELQQAETSYRMAIDELDSQDEGFVWLRNYSQVTRQLNLAHTQAQEAKSEALANLTETKSNAQMALALARDQIGQAQALLSQPLSTDTLDRQFQDLHRALQSADTLLDAMESSMDTGDYIQVMTSAHAVETLALTIHQHILALINHSPSLKVQV